MIYGIVEQSGAAKVLLVDCPEKVWLWIATTSHSTSGPPGNYVAWRDGDGVCVCVGWVGPSGLEMGGAKMAKLFGGVLRQVKQYEVVKIGQARDQRKVLTFCSKPKN